MSENQPFQLDKAQIIERKKTLDDIKIQLKKDFVGIDSIIDNLLDYIQIWYLMPEILSRPVTVCLWGMTGVGKTDLVRKLVRYLNYQDRFAEVELGNSDSTTYYSSVAKILEQSGLNDEKPGIVLFDEIQRFNTIQPDGTPVPNTKYADFWELLSDGRLAKREKDDFDWYINDYLFTQKQRQKNPVMPNPEEPIPPHEDPNAEIGIWEANRFKRMLNMSEEVMDIAEMTRMQMFERVSDSKRKKKIYEPVNHSKTLILISGNLDEAFQMATQTSETDIDADIFHSFTKKITAVDIKNALTRRFRPEQVARFGNIHLIYPSLRRRDFELLIEKELIKVIERTKLRFHVDLAITKNVSQLIYRNGVFPVQGVRPVFSSVMDILETNLSKFLFESLLMDTFKIKIDYNFEEHYIIATFGRKSIKLPFIGRIDKIRDTQIADTVSNVSVHESGHAVIYGILFGLAPLQLKSKVASSYAGGFTFPHQIYETKESMIQKIMVYLAGGIAEEVIFGDKNATIGRSHDREQVTILAADYVRRYGFEEKFQTNYTLEYAYSMDKSKTDADIENMITALASQTRQLLTDYRTFLVDLSQKLFHAGSLEAKEVSKIAEPYGLNLQLKEEGYLHIADYNGKLF
ncbi:MAG: hypothetical protein RL757_86 [Bacteroidota bacterium]|jgi:cell division protease FtsH